MVLAVAAGCGKSADSVNAPATSAGTGAAATTGGTAAPAETQTFTSPAPTGDVTKPLVWGVYRETNSLDPIFAFDYPENTVIFNMCEALLQQQPDGTIADGLGTVDEPRSDHDRDHAQGRRQVLGRQDDDGRRRGLQPRRARDPKLGGFYPRCSRA